MPDPSRPEAAAHDEGRAPSAAPGDAPFPAALTLIGLAVAVGLFSFLHSPFFHVVEVVVEGLDAVPAEELLLLGGVYPGDNILQVDLDKLAGRVAAHPRVRHVHVDRRLPDKLLVVVQEHTPVAFVPREGGEEGAAEAAVGSEAGFTAVNESSEAVPLIGDEGERLPVVVAASRRASAAAVAAAAAMPAPLRARLATVEAEEGPDGLLLAAYTRDGRLILLGDEEDLVRKGAIAASLLEEGDYETVDVRFPRSPAVRPR